MAGAAVFNGPLFVYGGAIRDGCAVSDGEVADEAEVVDTFFRICGWDDRRQGGRFNDDNWLCGIDDEGRFDQRGPGCRWAKGSWCGGWGTGRGQRQIKADKRDPPAAEEEAS